MIIGSKFVPIRSSLLGLFCSFRGRLFWPSRSREDVAPSVISPVARALNPRALRLRPRHLNRPRFRPDRIIDREFVKKRCLGHSLEFFRQAHLLAANALEGISAVEIRRFDDKRVTLPMALRVA